jgi:hypothetical protein
MYKIIKSAVLALTVVALCSPMFAQTVSPTEGDNHGSGVYQLNYFSNRNNPAGADVSVRIINTGTHGDPLSSNEGRVCANIYMFDQQQEMLECCACKLTANDLMTLSVNNNLMQNPLTGFPAPDTGAIKIVSDYKSTCDPTTLNNPRYQLVAWATHIQQPVTGTFVTTETAFTPGQLSYQEQNFLPLACAFVRFLGSGKGTCSCGTADISH